MEVLKDISIQSFLYQSLLDFCIVDGTNCEFGTALLSLSVGKLYPDRGDKYPSV